MTFLINLIGPPAGGKSTFAARYVLEHPEFKYCAIDEYRISYKDENLAWRAFSNDIRKSDLVIIESVGLSWRLIDIFNSEEVRLGNIYTIAFLGDPETLHQRLTSRQKRVVPKKPSDDDEHLTLNHVLEHIEKSIAPIDLTVNSTAISIKDLYQELSLCISAERIKSLDKKDRRIETFPVRQE